MEKIISEIFGCKVVERSTELYIQYDSGQSGGYIVENKITADEAKKATISEKDAYEVILKAQKRENPRKVK